MLLAAKIFLAVVLPMPYIYVRPISPLLFFGRSTPDILAISCYLVFSVINYPWRCLNLGVFLLMTYTTPFLRTILQSTLLFLTDALTFILFQFDGDAKY